MRTFPLELLVIKVLRGSRLSGPDARFRYLLTEMADSLDRIAIEDPANSNNDVSLDQVRGRLAQAAASTFKTAELSGWSAIFGAGGATSEPMKAAALRVSVGRTHHETSRRQIDEFHARLILRHCSWLRGSGIGCG